jgi:curved DNA-binding protein CbpA
MTTNTTKFFKGITNLEQLRSTYKDLIKKNHPDNGGDTETMKEINIEYKKIFEELKKGVKFETADAKQDEKTKMEL